jgi:hypothetical protein
VNPVWEIILYLIGFGSGLTEEDMIAGGVVAALIVGSLALGLFIATRKRREDDN